MSKSLHLYADYWTYYGPAIAASTTLQSQWRGTLIPIPGRNRIRIVNATFNISATSLADDRKLNMVGFDFYAQFFNNDGSTNFFLVLCPATFNFPQPISYGAGFSGCSTYPIDVGPLIVVQGNRQLPSPIQFRFDLDVDVANTDGAAPHNYVIYMCMLYELE